MKKLRILKYFCFLISLFWTLGIQAQTPQELFTQMETALFQAKTIQIHFKSKFEGEIQDRSEGTIILATGNRLWLKISGTVYKNPLSRKLISDGKQMVVWDMKTKSRIKTTHTPDHLWENFLIMIQRMGYGGLLMALETGDGIGEGFLKNTLKLSKWKPILEQKEHATFDFELRVAPSLPPFHTKFVFNKRYHLPFQIIHEATRQYRVKHQETYTYFWINTALPKNFFHIPPTQNYSKSSN